MDKQEIFSTVKDHLLSQGCRASDGDSCCYRGLDGTRCAIGCLIPDDLYKPAIEGWAVSCLSVIDKKWSAEGVGSEVLADVLNKMNMDTDHLFLLIDLQELHDRLSPAEWKDGLLTVATKHGLEYERKLG